MPKNEAVMPISEELCSLFDPAVKFFQEIGTESSVAVYAHIDADGISAASIIQKLLEDFKIKRFRISFLGRLDIVGRTKIEHDQSKIIILLDFSFVETSALKSNQKILLIDHHPILPSILQKLLEKSNLTILNPSSEDRYHSYQMSFSTSMLAYFLYERIMEKGSSLLAIPAALGALSDRIPATQRLKKQTEKPLTLIFEQMIKSSLIIRRTGLLQLYGLATRNLYSLMMFTDFETPLYHNIKETINFFKRLSIASPKQTQYLNLSAKDQQILIEEFEKFLTPTQLKELRSDTYLMTFTQRKPLIPFLPFIPLYRTSASKILQLQEIATILNVTGRWNLPEVGVAITRGDYDSLILGLNLFYKQKKLLRGLIEQIREDRLLFKQGSCLFFELEEEVAPLLSVICATFAERFIKYVVIGATSISDNMTVVKISLRTSMVFLKQHPSFDLNRIISTLAPSYGGEGGGHRGAVGALIPSSVNYHFLQALISEINEEIQTE